MVRALVLLVGFSVLAIELAAARLLDPWFGNSLVVWSVVLAAMLAYLSTGYWLGGRIADRWPANNVLYRLVVLAGLSLAFVPVASKPMLVTTAGAIANAEVGLFFGALFAVVFLFSIPVTLLGCVSPFAIRVVLSRVDRGGRVAGNLYALGTLGSIMGALVPVFALIPTIGTRLTILTVAGMLTTAGALGLWFSRSARMADRVLAGSPLVVALLVWVGAGFPIREAQGLIHETESSYNYIQVLERGGERTLRINDCASVQSTFREDDVLTRSVVDYFVLAPFFRDRTEAPPNVRRIAILGLAGGSMARLYAAAFPGVGMDGVEIDGAIVEVGRRYFALDQPGLSVVVGDARLFLYQSRSEYDVIIVDAYRPPYIPFHLCTREFFSLCRSRLTHRGVIAINVGRARGDEAFVRAITRTLLTSFASALRLDVDRGGGIMSSTMLVGTGTSVSPDDAYANLAGLREGLLRRVADRAGLLPLGIRRAEVRADDPCFSDDLAPVEMMIHRGVLERLTGR